METISRRRRVEIIRFLQKQQVKYLELSPRIIIHATYLFEFILYYHINRKRMSSSETIYYSDFEKGNNYKKRIKNLCESVRNEIKLKKQ